MKIISSTFNRLAIMFFLLLATTVSFAQDQGGGGATDVNVDINSDGGNWYAQPWVWIVGGALFILLLIALLRGGGSRRD